MFKGFNLLKDKIICSSMDIIPCFPGRSIELKEMFTLEVKAGARCHG